MRGDQGAELEVEFVVVHSDGEGKRARRRGDRERGPLVDQQLVVDLRCAVRFRV